MATKRLLGLTVTAVWLVLNASDAGAQRYPDKPIRIVVAAAPGGPGDFPARLAARILSPKFGQPVVVENRAGAGGAIGAREVAKASPDGYTLLLGNTATHAVIPAVSNNAGYDPIQNFAPVIRITEGFQILVVNPSSTFISIKQLVDASKVDPAKLSYAHSGTGGLPHLAGELFMLRSGARMTGISYRSGGESMSAVMGQSVDATLENIAILAPLIREGKLRGLAAQNATRTKLLPDVPTMAEAGVPDAEANTFFGLVAPAGTPANVIKALNDAVNEGLQMPEIQALIRNAGSDPVRNSPEEFTAYIAAQHRKWLDVGKVAGIKIN